MNNLIRISKGLDDQGFIVQNPNQKLAWDLDRLEFPQNIADIIGVRKETINFWKRRGCRFIGRKTTVRWVRQFMASISGGADHGIA